MTSLSLALFVSRDPGRVREAIGSSHLSPSVLRVWSYDYLSGDAWF